MRRLVIIVLMGLTASSVPSIASARRIPAGPVVVHTHRVPVAMHKVVPPFRGVHVYAKPVR